MSPSLSKTEMHVMSVVWQEGGRACAKRLAEVLATKFGYTSATSYTLISRCVKKGALERVEPGYICHARVSQRDMQISETGNLVQRVFDGSVDKLFSFLVGDKKASQEDIDRLRALIDSEE